ncbi:MAG: hypothetical protein HYT16_02960 [DPANN group archaeon]|nr:hypothetical protein [DPANN group archaeon]
MKRVEGVLSIVNVPVGTHTFDALLLFGGRVYDIAWTSPPARMVAGRIPYMSTGSEELQEVERRLGALSPPVEFDLFAKGYGNVPFVAASAGAGLNAPGAVILSSQNTEAWRVVLQITLEKRLEQQGSV